MAMKKKTVNEEDNAAVLPAVPELPETTVNPVVRPEEASPVAPAQRRPNENGSLGESGFVLSPISIDAVQKSCLESPTLANLTIGKNYDEVKDMFQDFFAFQLGLSREAKSNRL
jgi:hypothetical protein